MAGFIQTPDITDEAKKRFTEATEVCEEVHERFQQVGSFGKRWEKYGQVVDENGKN
jgi:hypothetical protein